MGVPFTVTRFRFHPDPTLNLAGHQSPFPAENQSATGDWHGTGTLIVVPAILPTGFDPGAHFAQFMWRLVRFRPILFLRCINGL